MLLIGPHFSRFRSVGQDSSARLAAVMVEQGASCLHCCRRFYYITMIHRSRPALLDPAIKVKMWMRNRQICWQTWLSQRPITSAHYISTYAEVDVFL